MNLSNETLSFRTLSVKILSTALYLCFHGVIRLDVSSVSGAIPVYIKNGIIAKHVMDLDTPSDIEIVPIEINIRKQKWLLFPFCIGIHHKIKRILLKILRES